MTRQFTMPQLNTRPFLLEDDNKLGMYGTVSQKEITEKRKADDKRYAEIHK